MFPSIPAKGSLKIWIRSLMEEIETLVKENCEFENRKYSIRIAKFWDSSDWKKSYASFVCSILPPPEEDPWLRTSLRRSTRTRRMTFFQMSSQITNCGTLLHVRMIKIKMQSLETMVFFIRSYYESVNVSIGRFLKGSKTDVTEKTEYRRKSASISL